MWKDDDPLMQIPQFTPDIIKNSTLPPLEMKAALQQLIILQRAQADTLQAIVEGNPKALIRSRAAVVTGNKKIDSTMKLRAQQKKRQARVKKGKDKKSAIKQRHTTGNMRGKKRQRDEYKDQRHGGTTAQLCRDYSRGACRHGDDCYRIHDVNERNAIRDNRPKRQKAHNARQSPRQSSRPPRPPSRVQGTQPRGGQDYGPGDNAQAAPRWQQRALGPGGGSSERVVVIGSNPSSLPSNRREQNRGRNHKQAKRGYGGGQRR